MGRGVGRVARKVHPGYARGLLALGCKDKVRQGKGGRKARVGAALGVGVGM